MILVWLGPVLAVVVALLLSSHCFVGDTMNRQTFSLQARLMLIHLSSLQVFLTFIFPLTAVLLKVQIESEDAVRFHSR